MTVKRIVAHITAPDPKAAQRFYRDILGLELSTENSFTVTHGSSEKTVVQLSFGPAGGSGAPTANLSLEVDDLLEVQRRLSDAGVAVEQAPVAEPSGRQAMLVRDPFGVPIHISEHAPPIVSGYIRGNSRHDR